MNRDTKLIILAVVLIVLAVGLFARYFSSGSDRARPGGTADIEKQIADIQNNPHMPPQAKAIAINQIRSHGAGMSQPLAPGTKK